ncbi:response regulator transcription factor [Vibrio sagamiensis]|uniref:HTH luxR-type domain-containing protein n=1 Tax=Vibrio sagamiensis NBRC 104589 TaxID=1219064 RepID=A0A511QDI2_9VIBR|nr:LuxR C-terminal-related transcriptional regulator [Vibrio sagamiensis]GEM74482.1 hypothetical protein VSA01S_05940 [Vibrio sagamiensis NBRC 104589]
MDIETEKIKTEKVKTSSFEMLLVEQVQALTTSRAEQCESQLKQFMLEAMTWFNIDRMTIFPNSMLFFYMGKTLSASRTKRKHIAAEQIGIKGAEDYLKLVGSNDKSQTFTRHDLIFSNISLLKLLAEQGANFHYTIPLIQFGQRWGGVSFTLFGEDTQGLSSKQLEQVNVIAHMWLSYWQHSTLYRSVHDPKRKPDDESYRMLRLSHRQCEVLGLLAKGMSAKEVGTVLNLSSRTIESHKYRLLDTLELESHTDLIQFALRNGIGY